MLFKLVTKKDSHNVRVQMIRELRNLTDCSLKEACNMIPFGINKGTVLEVNILPGKKDSYMEFFSIYTSRSQVKPMVRQALNIAIDNDELGLAKDLLSIMEKWL